MKASSQTVSTVRRAATYRSTSTGVRPPGDVSDQISFCRHRRARGGTHLAKRLADDAGCRGQAEESYDRRDGDVRPGRAACPDPGADCNHGEAHKNIVAQAQPNGERLAAARAGSVD